MYTLKKESQLLERLGTLTTVGVMQAFIKIAVCVAFFYVISLFDSVQECVLLAVSIFATENFQTLNILSEYKKTSSITFFQGECLSVNTMMIILSYTFHPFITQNYISNQNLFIRLFANIFFSIMIGMTWAFLASYSLKQSYKPITPSKIGSPDSHRTLRERSHEDGEDDSVGNNVAMDNFDILMMILSPIVSYLMAETFAISGLLSLMCCALVQSIYASKNLEIERASLLLNAFKALSYTFRSICEILIGLSFVLHTRAFVNIGYWTLGMTLAFIYLTSYGVSYLVIQRYRQAALIKNDTESLVLMIQSNTRGVIGFTLALQNFSTRISAIAVFYIVLTTLILEPIMNFMLNRHLKIMALSLEEEDDIETPAVAAGKS